MKVLKSIAALAFAAGLTACGTVPDINLAKPPFEQVVSQSANGSASLLPVGLSTEWPNPFSLRVSDVRVVVPDHLKISEANLYYPIADIVWRGDPRGDRRAQIRSMFQTGFVHGTKRFQGNRPVVLDVEITRFHSLSEKARYTIGGVHNIEFFLTVRDARTGEPVYPRRHIEKELVAYGGAEAMAAEGRGETQKVRVISYLAHVIDQEMRTRPAQQVKKKSRNKEPGI